MEAIVSFLPMILIIAVFYFFMIRPENKKRKAAEAMRNNLAVGDKITTIGGMIGTVVDVDAENLVFETSEDRVRIKMAKWGISTVNTKTEEK